MDFTLLTSTIPEVPMLQSDEWYWRWGALLGMTAVVCLLCFKNPKRSHND